MSDLLCPVDRLRHRLRRRGPAHFGFALADGIDYLDGAAWDALVRPHAVFLDRRYLRVLETAGPENLRPRYALVFRDRRPVAAVAAQSVHVKGEGLLPPDSHTRRTLLGRWEERLLVCGNLLSCGPHGVAFAEGESPAELWPAVAEALYRLRKADRQLGQHDFVLVKDLPAGDPETATTLQAFAYEPLETEPQMCLDLQPGWRTHADYLAALNTKYRGAARKVLKDVGEAGLRVTSGAVDSRDAEALHALYMQVLTQADVRLVTLPAAHFPALSEHLGADLRCTVVRRDDEPVAFVVTLRHGETATAYFVGFDREVAAPLYLRLLHAVVEDALALGCRRIEFGRTALEPKARLGARPQPVAVYLRHRVPVMNWLLRALLCNVQPEPAPERSPFKDPLPATP
jgi:hypothetical protein